MSSSSRRQNSIKEFRKTVSLRQEQLLRLQQSASLLKKIGQKQSSPIPGRGKTRLKIEFFMVENLNTSVLEYEEFNLLVVTGMSRKVVQ